MKVAVTILAIVAAGLAGQAIWKIDSGVKSPDLAGVTAADAEAELSAAGFWYVEETTYSNTSETGVVAKQEPAAGDKASKGSSVTIWVSQGAEKVAVPGRRAAAWSRAPSSRSTRPSARRSPRGRSSCCRSRNRPKLSAQLRVARGAAGRAAPPAQFAKPKT